MKKLIALAPLKRPLEATADTSSESKRCRFIDDRQDISALKTSFKDQLKRLYQLPGDITETDAFNALFQQTLTRYESHWLDIQSFQRLLLSVGLTPPCDDFFNSFIGSFIHNMDHLTQTVDELIKTSLVLYGDLDYAIPLITQYTPDATPHRPDSKALLQERQRRVPEARITRIPPEKAFMLGHIGDRDRRSVGQQIELLQHIIPLLNTDTPIPDLFTSCPTAVSDDDRLELGHQIASYRTQNNVNLPQQLTQKLDQLQEQHQALTLAKQEAEQTAIANTEQYLKMKNLDIYVAISMRQLADFQFISQVADTFDTHPLLNDLNISYFDPTQTIDAADIIPMKGVIEQLLLKKSKICFYNAQYTDTFGKDSELQITNTHPGKHVIVYVPQDAEIHANPDTFKSHVLTLKEQQFSVNKAIDNLQEELERRAVTDADGTRIQKGVARLSQLKQQAALIQRELQPLEKRFSAYESLERRASIFQKYHPLSLTAEQQTGLMKGVLVVRNLDQAATLIRGILTDSLEYDVEDTPMNVFLRERITGSISRIATKNTSVKTAFWEQWPTPLEQQLQQNQAGLIKEEGSYTLGPTPKSEEWAQYKDHQLALAHGQDRHHSRTQGPSSAQFLSAYLDSVDTSTTPFSVIKNQVAQLLHKPLNMDKIIMDALTLQQRLAPSTLGQKLTLALLAQQDHKTLADTFPTECLTNVYKDEIDALTTYFSQAPRNVLYLVSNPHQLVADAAVIAELREQGHSVTLGLETTNRHNQLTLSQCQALQALLPVLKTTPMVSTQDKDLPHSTLGVDLNHTSQAFKTAWQSADMLISKGQGHYDTLHTAAEAGHLTRNIAFFVPDSSTPFIECFTDPIITVHPAIKTLMNGYRDQLQEAIDQAHDAGKRVVYGSCPIGSLGDYATNASIAGFVKDRYVERFPNTLFLNPADINANPELFRIFKDHNLPKNIGDAYMYLWRQILRKPGNIDESNFVDRADIEDYFQHLQTPPQGVYDRYLSFDRSTGATQEWNLLLELNQLKGMAHIPFRVHGNIHHNPTPITSNQY